ncbi:MAG: serine/threonine-protein kinase, partial [Verrucomicrobiota bacterium]
MTGDHQDISGLVEAVANIDCHQCEAEVDVSDVPPFSSFNCPECGALLPVPGLLKNFVLLRELGHGAMGSVYLGFDQTLQRQVAIKVMHREFGNDPAFVNNFVREARALAALNHRNVVQVYSCGQVGTQPYIVMELVDGGGLEEQMNSGEPMDEAEALRVGLEAARGLEAANVIGLIHGDVKPENILYDKRGA